VFPGKVAVNRQIPQLDPLPKRANQIFNDCPKRNLAKETLGLQERIVPDSNSVYPIAERRQPTRLTQIEKSHFGHHTQY